jgi:hypothetical protein
MKGSSESFWIYETNGTKVRAHSQTRNVYSAPTLDGPPELIQRFKSYALDDGTPLNLIDENTFETLTGQRLSRIKPGNAP